MKTKSRNFLITSLAMIVMMVAILFSAVTISPLTAYAAERADREIVAVDTGNSFNMRLSDTGVLTWDEVTGATGYTAWDVAYRYDIDGEIQHNTAWSYEDEYDYYPAEYWVDDPQYSYPDGVINVTGINQSSGDLEEVVE